MSNTLFNYRTNNHEKSEDTSDSKVDDIKVEPAIEMYEDNGIIENNENCENIENNEFEDEIKSEFPYEEDDNLEDDDFKIDDNLDDEDFDIKKEYKKKPRKSKKSEGSILE